MVIANDTNVFTFIGKFIDINSVNYAPSAAKLTVKKRHSLDQQKVLNLLNSMPLVIMLHRAEQ